MSDLKLSPRQMIIKEYLTITAAVMIMSIGIYFFKFPNHFAFGGVSGLATVLSAMTGMTASTFTNIANYALLVVGFIFLGRSVGTKTVYATVVMSASLALLERSVPLDGPLTEEPLLELIFAIACPAVGSAMLFNIQASSGGTDIIAMILKKHTSIQIGTALLFVDLASVILSFFVFGPSTGLYSVLGLVGKSLGIDTLIESMNLSKCFTIICDEPDEICSFIIKELRRSATVYKAEGAFTHQPKTVILADMKPSQAVQLRNFIKQTQKGVFMQITNSSEIIGRGRGFTQG
ncbi:MAG: YitT family protein [Firmicutes bacterium]|nr:YitT family protein [Bacillota bacterium]